MPSEKLEPCPFCGCLASVQLEGQGYHVRCNYSRDCGGIGPYKVLKSQAEAAWNQRATLSQQGEAEEAGPGRVLRFDIYASAEPEAGLHGFSDTVEVSVDSGNDCDPDGDFVTFLTSAFKEWYDGAEVELSADYLAPPSAPVTPEPEQPGERE